MAIPSGILFTITQHGCVTTYHICNYISRSSVVKRSLSKKLLHYIQKWNMMEYLHTLFRIALTVIDCGFEFQPYGSIPLLIIFSDLEVQ